LHAAAEKGLLEHVKVLLEAGADARAVDYAGRSVRACAELGKDAKVAAEIRTLLGG